MTLRLLGLDGSSVMRRETIKRQTHCVCRWWEGNHLLFHVQSPDLEKVKRAKAHAVAY